MKKIYCFSIAFFLLTTLSAQINHNFKKMYETADDFVYKENYIDALPYFKKLNEMEPNNSNIHFYLGLCYLNSFSEKDKALQYLERASQNVSTDYYGNFNETSAPVFAYYYLGKAYFLDYKFDLARDNFEKFKYYLTSEDKALLSDVKRQIELTYNAKNLIANPIEFKFTNLGDSINSEYPDYAPVMSPDQTFFIFTSRREGSKGNKKDAKGKYFEDIYFANYDKSTNSFSNVKPIPGNVNTSGHEASISISIDGSSLFIYRDDNGDGNIYISYNEDGKWTAAEKLANGINTKYYENHACLAPDGETLYFISDRPGGFGGKDIWTAKRIGKNNWGQIENLGHKINTEYDEESPMILADGKTIYFSSKGHDCVGGYDIFYSIFENGEWSTPRNIGYPLNTVYDEVFFVPTIDGKEAYFATNLTEGFGDLDIYKVVIYDQANNMAVLNGYVKDTTTNSTLKSKVSIYDINTGEKYTETESDEKNGEFNASLLKGKKYKIVITAEDGHETIDYIDIPEAENKELSFSKPYYFSNVVAMSPDTILERINVGQRLGDRFVLRNVYFDFDKSTLRPESKTELDRLVMLLKAIPEMKIEISGHTDNYGSSNYNKRLSKNRAIAVVDYLTQHGIAASRLSHAGYGFDLPIATNETDAGRQLNRRAEFRITSLSYSKDLAGNITYNIKDIKGYKSEYSDVLKDYTSRWYIIGGSFTFLKNAEKYRNEIRERGYTNAEIVGQNSTGSYRVAFNGYDSKEEALKALNKMKKEGEGLWILNK